MSYNRISLGSQNDDVKTAQELLNSAGNYNLTVDGIFGQQTNQAVMDYQRQNGLVVDGIIGEQTWAALTGQSESAPETPSTPTDYEIYAGQMEALYNRWTEQDPFSYHVEEDPLFHQYRDAYTHQGRLAMMDTMGQVAALTGGYGSTYAQVAGQQTFQNYMQKLQEVVPELYGMAYDRYRDENDRLYTQYQLAQSMADNAYDRQSDRYANLVGLMAMGYVPSEEEIRQAGLTQEQAEIILASYRPTGGGGGTVNLAEGVLTPEQVARLQETLLSKGYNIAVDGVYGTQTQTAVNNYFGGETAPSQAYWKFALVDGIQNFFDNFRKDENAT